MSSLALLPFPVRTLRVGLIQALDPQMTTSRHRHIATVLFAAVATTGCEAQYKDVSGEDDHRSLVGNRCELLVSLRAHGAGEKYGPDKKTEYVSVWNPGFTGPEVTFVSSLSAGASIRVIAARECWNCPFERRIHYQVQLLPETAEFAGLPVLVRAESFTHREVKCRASDEAA